LTVTTADSPQDFFWFAGTDLGSEGSFYWSTNGKPIVFGDFAKNMPDKAQSTVFYFGLDTNGMIIIAKINSDLFANLYGRQDFH
jgi:hypothetical protein